MKVDDSSMHEDDNQTPTAPHVLHMVMPYRKRQQLLYRSIVVPFDTRHTAVSPQPSGNVEVGMNGGCPLHYGVSLWAGV